METADVVIPGMPEDVIVALDARAGRLGLSRDEYVRRLLAWDAARDDSPITHTDLTRFADIFRDLRDRDVMSQAWR